MTIQPDTIPVATIARPLDPAQESFEHGPMVMLAIVLAIISYVNILGGEFVYDDTTQIVDNYQIKHSQLWARALTSDVWSFKGATGGSWSNYWRPTFVAWMILNYCLFGVENSFGWHLGNLALHIACIGLLYATLIRLQVSPRIASSITCIFAVHPAHVETVAWISGSVDMLMTIGLLGSVLFILPPLGKRKHRFLATGCFLLALFSKETAMLFPFVIFAIGALRRPRPISRDGLAHGCQAAWPFVLAVLVYIALRVRCLGFFQQPQDQSAGLAEMLMTWPIVAMFYIRQSLFPLWMGPSYPIRLVDSFSVTEFVIPALLFGMTALLMLWAALRSRISAIGLVLFIFTLAPAMNVRVFTPEQIVHDRYLYFPLAGLLMVIFPLLGSLLKKWRLGDRDRVEEVLSALTLILCLPLMFKTMQYNRAWATEVALWEWGVQSDPGSMFNHTQLGVALAHDDQPDEALLALNRAIELAPLPEAYQPNAYLQRSEIYIEQQRFADAERDLRLVLESYPDDFRSFERLALSFERQQRLDEAEAVLRQARDQIPYRKAELTERIAIILHQQGKLGEALQELLDYQEIARQEPGPRAKLVLFRLGLIYLQKNQLPVARSYFEEYLDLTGGAVDPVSTTARANALNQLNALRR